MGNQQLSPTSPSSDLKKDGIFGKQQQDLAAPFNVILIDIHMNLNFFPSGKNISRRNYQIPSFVKLQTGTYSVSLWSSGSLIQTTFTLLN